jgi:adenylate kinase
MKPSKDKKAVILMGPPGAGKGTQASLLAEKFSFYYLETSKLLEDSFKNADDKEFITAGGKKYFLKEEKRLWETGVLCDPPFVSQLVKEKIKSLYDMGESIVLAGSPRTLFEGKALMPFLKKIFGKKNIKIVLINLSPKDSIFRNSHRRICQLMRHPILYNKETLKLTKCPLDGSDLMKRKGLDDPKTIVVRLKEYRQRTFPLVSYFKKEGFGAKTVSGAGSVSDVFSKILRAIK